MKKIFIGLCALSSMNCLAGTLTTHQAVLDAASRLRAKHITSDAMSIEEYGVNGRIEINSLRNLKKGIRIQMTYAGPADFCQYVLDVNHQNEVSIKSTECSE